MAVSKSQILKYSFLPGIYPRIKNLLGSGFGKLAYMIALVYYTVRILPDNHFFLKTENIGKYSVRQVIAEAARHIEPSKKNIDQIIIFFSVITALIILALQFLILLLAVLIPQAKADVSMPATLEGFFVTPNPKEDIAYRMLDLVFGIPGLFNSKDLSATNFHTALHGLFEFYSYGILIVGIFILIYYVIAIVAETAQSGIPFGQRFNKAWAPIRVILFFALLIPVTNGINGGQYLLLTSAKLGSALASTGWLKYNEEITETLTGPAENNVATPTPPDLAYIPAYMLIAKTCQMGYHKIAIAIGNFGKSLDYSLKDGGIKAWIVYQDKEAAGYGYKAVLMSDTTFANVAESSASSSFSIIFGVRDETNYVDYNGAVYPVCGSLSMTITDLSEPGSAIIHQGYYQLILDSWNGAEDIQTYADNYLKKSAGIAGYKDPSAVTPDNTYKEKWKTYLDNYMNADDGIVPLAVAAQIKDGDWEFSDELRDYGWAGAAIWYNELAKQNGAIVSALHQPPVIIKYPDVMERIRDKALSENEGTPNKNIFEGAFKAGASPLEEKFPGDTIISLILVDVYRYWEGDEEDPDNYKTNNFLVDAINLLLGTEGLFDMCKNADVHPLAQLSSVGKSMVDSAIRSYAMAGLFGIASIIPSPLSGASSLFSSFFGSVGTIGLLVGFILYYILPFMPFLYFFFAVGGWVKGIFEAMVAMPLWALAHLRIDGDGIPGEAAIQGYYLLFEVFIRPILIVFGLLASITIFAAMVKVLNDIFYIAIANLAGHAVEEGTVCFSAPSDPDGEGFAAELSLNKRGPIDEFFFTIMYTIIVYMIGTACFKLIDMIPNNILRWINAEVPSFNDKTGDAGQGLVKFISIGGSQFGSQLGSSIGGLKSGFQGSSKEAMKFFGDK